MSLLYTDRNDLASLKGMTGGSLGGSRTTYLLYFLGGFTQHSAARHATTHVSYFILLLFLYYVRMPEHCQPRHPPVLCNLKRPQTSSQPFLKYSSPDTVCEPPHLTVRRSSTLRKAERREEENTRWRFSIKFPLFPSHCSDFLVPGSSEKPRAPFAVTWCLVICCSVPVWVGCHSMTAR